MDTNVVDTSNRYSVNDYGTLRIRDGATFDFNLISALMPHTGADIFAPSIGDMFTVLNWSSIIRRVGSTDQAFDPQFVTLNFDDAALGAGREWVANWGADSLTLT